MKGRSFTGCGKTPIRAGLRKDSDSRWVREGHEFHSCRNRRKFDGGLQPLGECRAGKALFRSLFSSAAQAEKDRGLALEGVSVRRLVPASSAAGVAVIQAVDAEAHGELGLAIYAEFFAHAARFKAFALGADDRAEAWF